MKHFNKSDNSESARWEEKHGEPLKRDVFIRGGTIQIGDEFFDVEDLENEKPVSTHPFKPHHYDLQKELEAIRAFYEKHPQRRP